MPISREKASPRRKPAPRDRIAVRESTPLEAAIDRLVDAVLSGSDNPEDWDDLQRLAERVLWEEGLEQIGAKVIRRP